MGCLLGCFGGAKDQKQQRRRRAKDHRRRTSLLRESPPKQLKSVAVAVDSIRELSLRENDTSLPPEIPREHLTSEIADDLVPELSFREEPEQDRLLRESSPKQVTLEVADESVPELREKPDQEGSTGGRKKVTFDLNVTTYEEAPAHEEAENSQEAEKDGGEGAPNRAAYPLNHRYQNCASSDDEDINDEDEEYDDSDFDEDDDEEYDDSDFDEDDDEVAVEGNEEEESYESFFSLPMEKEQKSFAEVSSPVPVKSTSEREPIVLAKGSARDRIQYVHSVLNPVENLSKWKQVKDRAAPPRDSVKENASSDLETKGTFCVEPTFKTRTTPTKPINRNPICNYSDKHEISVETSLSNWLSPVNSLMEGTQESNSIRSNSSVTREERPILGALTIEDIKQSSVTSSPRKSPSRSSDDIPIVGTVGGYWSSSKGESSSASWRSSSSTKGIPNTTSKYREDKRVNWHSTPFEERLERALKEVSAAEACPRLPPALF